MMISLNARPVAGECITPWPENPFAKYNPSTSHPPNIAWWSGVFS